MPTRVLHVLAGGLVSGGVETTALSLIRGHRRDQYDPALLVLSRRRDAIAEEFERLGIPIVLCEYDQRRPLRFVAKAAALIRVLRSDSVLCYSFSVIHLWVHLAASLARVERRVTRVAAWPLGQRSRRKLRALQVLGRPVCTHEIAVSHYVGEMLKGLGGYPAGRIMVVPNGCHVEDIRRRADIVRSACPAGRPPRILMVARMDEAKDHDTLIRAMALLKRELPAARLWLVGEGFRRPYLERLAAALGVSSEVEFLGTRRDVPELLGQVDAFVLSSHTEGFGIVLLEAMAAGVPVLASDIPSCREVLDRGQCGILTPVRDTRQMAASLKELLCDGGLRRRLAEAAFRRVQESYTMERVVRCYERLLDPQGGPLAGVPARNLGAL